MLEPHAYVHQSVFFVFFFLCFFFFFFFFCGAGAHFAFLCLPKKALSVR